MTSLITITNTHDDGLIPLRVMHVVILHTASASLGHCQTSCQTGETVMATLVGTIPVSVGWYFFSSILFSGPAGRLLTYSSCLQQQTTLNITLPPEVALTTTEILD